MTRLSSYFALLFVCQFCSADLQCERTHPSIWDPNAQKHVFLYQGFTRFDQLHLDCDVDFVLENWSKYNETFNHFPTVKFMPRIGVVLENALDFTCFARIPSFLDIHLYQIMALELDVAFIFDDVAAMDLYLFQTKFDFLFYGRIIDEHSCDYQVLKYVDVSIFTKMYSNSLIIDPAVDLAKPVCPYVFKGARFAGLDMIMVTNTTLTQHYLKYLNMRNLGNTSLKLDAYIERLTVQKMYNIAVDEGFLHPEIFESTKRFVLEGYFHFPNAEIFKYFSQLESLSLVIAEPREFFHSSTNEWMSYLMFDQESYANREQLINASLSTVDHRCMLLYLSSNVLQDYVYPDEDICLFKHFPVHKLIFAQVVNFVEKQVIKKDPETCTLAYLFQRNDIYNQYFKRELDSLYVYTLREFNQTFVEKCQFAERFKACGNFSAQPERELSYYDITYVFQWIEYVGPMITFPIVSAAGFILNMLVILVIKSKKNKKEKLFEARIYQYILMNSSFNCIECFVAVLRLLNECVAMNSLYCPWVHFDLTVQYLRIILTGYFSEVMKTCSIITNLFFSLERYYETSKHSGTFAEKFKKISLKKVVSFIIAFSMVTSVTKIFEFKIMPIVQTNYDLPYPFRHTNLYNWGLEKKLSDACYLIHYILNDFVFLLVNMIIDIKLMIFIKANVKQKYAIHEKMSGATGAETQTKEQKKNLENLKLAESKANSMVVSLFFVYLFSRSPELAGTFFMYFFTFSPAANATKDCKDLNVCYLVLNLIEYAYMISYITNIFFYHKFNMNFRQGFRAFFAIKTKKKEPATAVKFFERYVA